MCYVVRLGAISADHGGRAEYRDVAGEAGEFHSRGTGVANRFIVASARFVHD